MFEFLDPAMLEIHPWALKLHYGRKKDQKREVQRKQKFRMKESATAHRAAPVLSELFSLYLEEF